jgi:RNA polymerase sigma factor (sigma-70 family)
MDNGPLRRLLGFARRTADPTDDNGLLARFVATGDADAFELLVWRHGAMVLGVARRALGDEHAAEDVLQATFLALARQARSVRHDGCVGGWLHRVAWRMAVRAKRRVDRTLRSTMSPSECEDPIVAVVRGELSQILDEELDRLPEQFRRPVVLCYLEGRSTAEAAEQLGCPRGTVLSRLATAREKLRMRLQRRGVAPALLPPAIDLPAAVEGGLVDRTVRVAVATSAAPPVIELCDGVIRAMFLSKLQTAAAVVLTLGLIGGGAGWMARAPGGPALARADEPQRKAQPAPRDSQPTAMERAEVERAKLNREMDRSHQELAVLEDKLQRDRMIARMQVADAEERLKRAERLLAGIRDDALERLLQAKQQAAIARQNFDHFRHLPDKTEEKKESLENWEKRLKEAEANRKAMQDQFENNPPEPVKLVLQARHDVITAEERLSSLDRRSALRQRLVEAQVETLQSRLNHVQTGRPDPVDHKMEQLERKLDDVLRELNELRRELKK